jgi:hypothetical protein
VERSNVGGPSDPKGLRRLTGRLTGRGTVGRPPRPRRGAAQRRCRRRE